MQAAGTTTCHSGKPTVLICALHMEIYSDVTEKSCEPFCGFRGHWVGKPLERENLTFQRRTQLTETNLCWNTENSFRSTLGKVRVSGRNRRSEYIFGNLLRRFNNPILHSADLLLDWGKHLLFKMNCFHALLYTLVIAIWMQGKVVEY